MRSIYTTVVSVLAMEHWNSSIVLMTPPVGSWEFAEPVYMFFVDLEKAMTMFFELSCGSGGFCGRMEWMAHCYRQSSLQSLVHIAGKKSDLFL